MDAGDPPPKKRSADDHDAAKKCNKRVDISKQDKEPHEADQRKEPLVPGLRATQRNPKDKVVGKAAAALDAGDARKAPARDVSKWKKAFMGKGKGKGRK